MYVPDFYCLGVYHIRSRRKEEKSWPKLNMQCFLTEVVREIRKIDQITWTVNGQTVFSKLRVVCVCADAPARADLLNLKHHSGFFSCLLCETVGEKIEGMILFCVYLYLNNFI